MINVATSCTVVPDGVEQDARQPMALRFSILLTPTLPVSPAAPDIDLGSWPQVITTLLTGKGAVRIHLNYRNKPGWRTFNARIGRHDSQNFAAQSALAQRTWQRAFPEGESALEALRTVLLEESADRAARAAPPADTKKAWKRVYRHAGMDLSPANTTAPDTLILGQFLHALHLREIAQTLAAGNDNKSAGIRAARESSFALAQVLDGIRQKAADPAARKKFLRAAAEETAAKLAGFDTATKLLREGQAAALPADAAPPGSTLREGLSDLDKLMQDDWLKKTSAQVLRPVVLHEYATSYERRSPPKAEEEHATEAARRRFTGLRTQPTLAKLVRLLVDVELMIDKDTLPFDTKNALDEFGDVAVEIVADRTASSLMLAAQLPATRFRLHGTLGSAKSPLSFAPASRYEWPHPGGGSRNHFLPLVDGFLQLRAEPGRFYLRTFDVALGLNASAAAASERNAAKARGAESVGDRMAPLRSQGFELGDTKGGVEVASDMLKTLALSGSAEPFYAEDLLMGFRVDIERTVAGAQQPGPWHTATARSLAFQGIPLERGKHLFPAHEERDDGFVGAMARHVKEDDGVWTFARQELFSWSGEPLALPAARELPRDGQNSCPSPPPVGRGSPIACLVPQADLNIGVTYDFGPNGRSMIPALRLGDQYRFVLRACYGNGGGPRFAPAQQRELYAASALGATGLEAKISKAVGDDEAPAPFTTPDPVTAPNLALFANDPLVRASSTEKERPAEKYDQVVLRAEYRPDRTARRILLPPRIAFEQAEVQKQFDRIDVPRGALLEMRLDAQQGALPQAAGGKVMLAGPPGTHRGAVYENARQAVRPHPFFCDARGRCVVLALQRPGTTPDTGGEDVSPPLDDLRFWHPKQGPNDALPIVVEFRIAPIGTTGARFVGHPEVRTYASPGPSRALRVVVEVGLAEKIELCTWCIDEKLLYNNLFVATLIGIKSRKPPRTTSDAFSALDAIESASKKPDGDGKEFVQMLLRTYGGRAPLTFSDSLTWSVVAATRRPLIAPKFVLANGRPVLTALRLLAVKGEERWASPQRPTADDPEGTQVFLDGSVDVHRRSSGELRVQLLWRDFNDQVAVERVGDTWLSNPRWHRLEKTIAVALSEDKANDPVALDNEAAAQSKRLAFELGWQAMRIGVRLVSRTRFAHCYTPVQNVSGDDLSLFESENHAVGDFLPPGGAEDAERSIWLNATQRPAKPEVSAVELVRHFRELARSATSIVAESRWTLRLRFPKGSWHQSGEGELLALVLMPENAVSSTRSAKAAPHHRLDNDEFKFSDNLRRLDLFLGLRFTDPDQAALPKLMQLVSGWAVDPATDAGRLQPILSPGQFAGWVEKRADLTLPFALPQDGTQDKEELAKVAIIAYEPVLDAATGDRYVDVDFLSPDIDSPFVRLSVARYQPHALDGLWLSSQVCLDPAVLPSRRQVELRWQGASVLQVKVTGPAYRRRTLGAVEGPASKAEKELLANQAHKTDVPWMRISIQRLDREGSGFLAADAASLGLQREVAALAVSEQGLWEVEFDVPEGETRWRVFIEEVEFYLPGAGASRRETLETLPRGFKCELDVVVPTGPISSAPAPSAPPKRPPSPK
ncbi:MAG: hypothetical protein JWQ80_47 [Massilia sp.]|nr:hypothetical protein [Massilia sp.]